MAKKEQELTASMIDTFREFKETKNIDRNYIGKCIGGELP